MKNLLLVLVVSLIVFSCKKEEYNFDKVTMSELTPEYAVPVVKTTLALKDLIKSTENTGYLKEDANGLLSIAYRSSAFSKLAKDIILLPDQAPDPTSFTCTISKPFPPGDSVVVPYMREFVFETNNSENVDYLTLKAGTLNFNLSTDINYSAKINISSPQITKDGNPLSFNVNYSPGQIINQDIDLSGFKFDFPNDGQNKIGVLCKVIAYKKHGISEYIWIPRSTKYLT